MMKYSCYNCLLIYKQRTLFFISLVIICLAASIRFSQPASALSWPPIPKSLTAHRNRSRRWRQNLANRILRRDPNRDVKSFKTDSVIDENLNKLIASNFRGGDVEEVVSKLFADSREKASDVVQSVRILVFLLLNSVEIDMCTIVRRLPQKHYMFRSRGGGQRDSSKHTKALTTTNNKSISSQNGDFFETYGRYASLAMSCIASFQALTSILSHDRFFDEVCLVTQKIIVITSP